MIRFRIHLLFMVLVIIGIAGGTEAEVAYIVDAVETGRGEYENGKFTHGKPEFSYLFEVDEKTKYVVLHSVTRLADKTVIDVNVPYTIAAVEDGISSLSRYLSSERKQNQRVLFLVGKPGTHAAEVILLGQDFFEYCKAASGRFYLSTGTVDRTPKVK